MKLGLLRAMLDLARLRWEHRATEWGLRALGDTLRRDPGLPARLERHLRAGRPDWC